MKKWLLNISNQHEVILKCLLFIISCALLLWLLPHSVKYKFDYSVGKAWLNDDLVAPYDFSILKNKDSLEAERKLLLENAPVFVRRDSMVKPMVLERIDAKISNEYANVDVLSTEKIKTSCTMLIEALYKKGIAGDELLKSLSYSEVRLVNGNEMQSFADFIYKNQVQAVAEKFCNEKGIANMQAIVQIVTAVATPDILIDKNLTDRFKDQLIQTVLPTHGLVSKGEIIISKGEIVSPQKKLMLESLRELNEQFEQPNRHVQIGQLIIVIICLMLLMIFLAQQRKDIFADNRKLTLILLMVLFTVFIFTWSMRTAVVSLYLVPLCIMPIVIRVFFDTRLALFSYVITILIIGSVAPNGFDFVFTQIVAGMVTIFSIKNIRKRSHVFIAVLLIYFSYFICYIGLAIIHEGNMVSVKWENAFWLLANVLLTLFAYPLIYFLERIFGITSDISLIELADSNNQLLRELSIKAPGTFQHSLQVANLAEAAIFKIGGNALLIRVGALYHDIGKMEMPLYYIENQVTQVNPHDDLAFEESASIIIGHVLAGVEKAKKNNLPDIVIDFIRTHHGTSRVQYFYESFLKNFPDKLVDEEAFHYPGPKPFSKETAVLMMADSVEAASRSLQKHDAETISKLVDSIIEHQIEEEQFSNCNITFRDITELKKLFKKMLGSIYHVRIEYLH